MHKFDKIKTVADKRLALDKRGNLTPVDFKAGDKLILSEKLDGFNTSLDTLGRTFSRSNELGQDMTYFKKLLESVKQKGTDETSSIEDLDKMLSSVQVENPLSDEELFEIEFQEYASELESLKNTELRLELQRFNR